MKSINKLDMILKITLNTVPCLIINSEGTPISQVGLIM